jgi:hypothetical protein
MSECVIGKREGTKEGKESRRCENVWTLKMYLSRRRWCDVNIQTKMGRKKGREKRTNGCTERERERKRRKRLLHMCRHEKTQTKTKY